jgi:integrase/recombinase XerD
MNFIFAVERYLELKKRNGYEFETGIACLTAFSHRIGNIQLCQVTTRHVLCYLDESDGASVRWRIKHQILDRFFSYWSNLELASQVVMPPLKPKVRQTFAPYIYSRLQLRALLRATTYYKDRRDCISRQTMRTTMLLLYGTGALIGEVLRLQCSDIDLATAQILIRGKGASRFREIPVGADVLDVLRRYWAWRSRKKFLGAHFLISKFDRALNIHTVVKHFERLRRRAGVKRCGERYQPRLADFKFTFAVHRITSWIRNGADLDRMLPALAAYMGQAGLGSTERYMSLTAERFRKELEKLSPGPAKYSWRNDKALMEFLATL